MNTVLIMCDMFPPAFGPRMGYLCKYLPVNGWQTAVVAEHVDDDTFSFLQNCTADATYIRYYKQKGWAGKMEWIRIFICDVLFGYKDVRMYRAALEITKRQKFDLILCSAYRTFPLRAAGRLASKTGLPLVVDLRDVIEQYAGNEFIARRSSFIFNLPVIGKIITALFRRANIRMRNSVLRKAAAVTTVSPWHVSVLSACNPRAFLIYNGYDPELFFPAESDNAAETPFLITYTGRLLSVAMRNPELLFEAVERLANEGIITPSSFRIRWYVDDYSRQLLSQEAQKYPVTAALMDYRGYVPASEIPAVLREASILLLLTGKSGAGGTNGVMTTKLFEYMAVGKPLLCVRGDEGCVEEVINRTKSGLSAHNADEVYGFIKQRYLQWLQKTPVADNPDRAEIRKFSREEQAKQFIQIFRQILES